MKKSGIVFFFEENDIDVWSGRRIDLDAWNYAIKVGGNIDKVIVINKTQETLQTFDADVDFQVVTEIPVLNGSVAQIVCPWEDTPVIKQSLWDFNHDVDWYFYGPAHGWQNNYFANIFLTIPQNGMGACHSIHINTVIMFDRYKKQIII